MELSSRRRLLRPGQVLQSGEGLGHDRLPGDAADVRQGRTRPWLSVSLSSGLLIAAVLVVVAVAAAAL